MDIPLPTHDEQQASAMLEQLARQILMGDSDAYETLIGHFMRAEVVWERQTVALIALLMLPGTTLEGAREFMQVAFIGPILRGL